MVSLALKIAPHIRGRVHIQTNPYYSYSTEKTIANAIRMICRAEAMSLSLVTSWYHRQGSHDSSDTCNLSLTPLESASRSPAPGRACSPAVRSSSPAYVHWPPRCSL